MPALIREGGYDGCGNARNERMQGNIPVESLGARGDLGVWGAVMVDSGPRPAVAHTRAIPQAK